MKKLLYFYAILTLIIPNVALCFTERMGFFASAANVLLPLGLLWLAMSAGRRPGKAVLWLSVFIFFAAFQIVLLYLFGRSIIAVDMFLNLVTTNPGEALELLDNLVPAVATVVIIYVPLIVMAVLSLRRGERLGAIFLHRQRRVAAAVIAAGGLCLGASYAADPDYRASTRLYPLNVCYNVALAVQRTVRTAQYKETSAAFRFNARSTHPADSAEVYIMVIGETARAINFSLYGYSRPTTPMLSHEDGAVAFTHVLTESNTTHKSVPMLLSAARAGDHDRIYREKGVITAFKEAGFHTTFISNQRPNHSFIDFFGEEADTWVFIRESGHHGGSGGSGGRHPDADMLPMVREILARRRHREFIVLHTYGSHFNYRERYPEGTGRFMPDSPSEAEAENRPPLLNAYDNTIAYTDRLLSELTQMLRQRGCAAALLYTSDHGENIFDDGRRLFLHASPVPSYYELHVPLIVYTTPAYRRQHPTVAAALKANRDKAVSSSASAFHTMLALGGISTRVRNDSLSVASPVFTPHPRLYLNDHDEAVPVGKIVRDEEDRLMFRKRGFTDIGER